MELSIILVYITATVLVVNMLLALLTVFLERRESSVIWAWLLVLTFVPIVGFILYLIFGRNLSRGKIFDWKAQERIGINDIIKSQINLIKEGVFPFVEDTPEKHKEMVYLLLVNDGAPLTQDNDVEILIDGKKKFESLFRDIEAAKDHIHLIYYIFRFDELGTSLVDLLVKKAKEGVEVRFIYDAMGSRSVRPSAFKELEKHGGKAYPFFPSKLPLINFRLNYRNHRKLAIIDGEIGYIGGFNIGDEYLGKSKKFGNWRDTHLRVKGSANFAMQARYIMDWNSAATHKADKIKYDERYFPLAYKHEGNIPMQIVSSGPDTDLEQIKNGYIKLINSAKDTIFIQTPYFIPDNSVLESLKIAALSGVDVRVMIPSMPDHPFVYWSTTNHVSELLKCGAKVFRYNDGFLHAKTVIVDAEVSSVGTANIDNRSFRLNFEVNAFIYDEEMGRELHNIFLDDMLVSSEMTLEEYEKRSNWIKFKEGVSRLLSPIL
ncbi:cardiolipin synthase [Brochothrix thermosphacta]|uniref:Cardiolipin synthase n=1 Tax=Brochothrix thermosphacta TaxID=2756 RepID=A0A291KG42_BROTH|nr:cardiolipin synthase [Brochothrix thermosphacta]ATF26174.1 cardiolipin synthase [Brochothrix thermosphacta]ATH85513.1 cardiolipin synthase [Brochothrix thermosphacta]